MVTWFGVYAVIALCSRLVDYFSWKNTLIAEGYKATELAATQTIMGWLSPMVPVVFTAIVLALLLKVLKSYINSKTTRLEYSTAAKVWFIICLVFSILLSLYFLIVCTSGGAMYEFQMSFYAVSAVCLTVTYLYLLLRNRAGVLILKCISSYYFTMFSYEIFNSVWNGILRPESVEFYQGNMQAIIFDFIIVPVGFAAPMIISLAATMLLLKKTGRREIQ